MLLNAQNLQGLTTGFRSHFNTGFNMAESHYQKIATTVPSSTSKESYPWLGDLPGIRKWIGDREIHKLEQHGYTIVNEPWEMTFKVDRDSIEDDQYGVYAPMFSNMGFETNTFPDELVFGLLQDGFTVGGYDGQYFFDTDHMGYDEAGSEISYSNFGGGAGAPWFLLDVRKPLKPIIFQQRRAFDFVAMDNPEDENVFMRKEFVYGVDGRMNVGFGFHQQAYASKDTLNDTNFNNALAAMMGQKKRSGKPLGVNPNLLVVGATNRATALEVVKAERRANGATNINRDVVDVLVTEWLS